MQTPAPLSARYRYFALLTGVIAIDCFRTSRGKSIRRRFCERQTVAGLRAPEDRAARHGRRQAVRHFAAATRVPRLRLQDTHEILRDGKYPAWQHWRKQDEGKISLSFLAKCVYYIYI